MIHAVIIDDELHCIQWLSDLLNAEFAKKIQLTGTAQTVEEGIKLIATTQPDLVFLDIQLHEKTGFDLLRQVPDPDFDIIFTTAYDKFAIQAIKFSAIDYLLKPIDEDDLNLSLLRVMSEKSKKVTTEKINLLLAQTQKKETFKKIIVPTFSGFEFLEIENMVRCQSDINYTIIYLKDKQKIVVAKTLKEFEEMLSDYNFFRIHNSHLINLSFIKSYHRGKGGSVKLTDGSEIEVSTRRKEAFINKLSQL